MIVLKIVRGSYRAYDRPMDQHAKGVAYSRYVAPFEVMAAGSGYQAAEQREIFSFIKIHFYESFLEVEIFDKRNCTCVNFTCRFLRFYCAEVRLHMFHSGRV